MVHNPESRDPRSRWDIPRSVRHLEAIVKIISKAGEDITGEPNSEFVLSRQAGAFLAVKRMAEEALEDYYKMVREEVEEAEREKQHQ